MADTNRNRAGSGGTRKIGRDREKCKHYRSRNRREYNKLKRIRQSNGLLAAEKYAKKHGLTFYE